MTRPLLEVADIVRAQGDRFIQELPLDPLGPSESTPRDRSLPYRGTRWASRQMPALWVSHHLL